MEPAPGKILRFECVARTHAGCRRKINEDAMLSRPDLGLWAVADGMGGHEAGEVASALVVGMLEGAGAEAELSARIAKSGAVLHKANQLLQSMAQESGSRRTIGTTIVLMAVDRTSFACLWAGDSRAYLARDGALAQLTHDHSLVQQLVDSGDIDPGLAAKHPNANVILRAVGAMPELEIDNVEGEVRAGDVFLLASDGLTRLVSDSEILDQLGASNLEAAADRLLDMCLDRKAPDNVTFVIVRMHLQ
ncbi:MAG TPA: protein phosphatase 2C domain-containing protein [Rhizomicrobium sp.]|jgi:serine/threonine protein phosphatase PrpC|nr:protein phosphatase 2C domain-containing protein [Rhizomicrobium sp.]